MRVDVSINQVSSFRLKMEMIIKNGLAMEKNGPVIRKNAVAAKKNGLVVKKNAFAMEKMDL